MVQLLMIIRHMNKDTGLGLFFLLEFSQVWVNFGFVMWFRFPCECGSNSKTLRPRIITKVHNQENA